MWYYRIVNDISISIVIMNFLLSLSSSFNSIRDHRNKKESERGEVSYTWRYCILVNIYFLLQSWVQTEVGIECSVVHMSSGGGNLPSFTTFYFFDPWSNLKFFVLVNVTGSAKTRHNGAFFRCFIIEYL